MALITGGSPRSRVAVVAGLFLVSVVTGAWLLDRGSRTGTFTAYEAAHLFDQVFDHVSGDYVDTLSDSVLYRKAVDGMLYELHDPYSLFLPPDRLARVSEVVPQTKADAGTGVELDLDNSDGSIVVVVPLPGSPAERAGILPDDRIMRIDGKSTEGWTREEAGRALRGKPGSTVALQLDRPGAPKPLNVSLTRQEISQRALVRTAMLPDAVGYIGLAAFGDSTAAEVSGDIHALLARGMRALVLDLRANPAGSLAHGLEISDLFLDAGQRIVAAKGRTASSERVYQDSSKQRWPSLPLAILVDGRSGNAAEVVAGALQDHDRAVIVGRPTYGSGSAQGVVPIDGAGGVRLTIARWFTPSGRMIGKPAIDEEDEDAVNALKLQRHKKFRTDSGRAVYGIGGITPDVLAGDTVLSPVEIAFAKKLGTKTGAFRDGLTAYAMALKVRHGVSSPDFAVTPAMREELWRGMTVKGVLTDRTAFDQAEPLVSRLLAYEIARTVFGVDAEFRRRSASDAALAKALRLAQGVKGQQDLLRRAALANASSDSTAAK